MKIIYVVFSPNDIGRYAPGYAATYAVYPGFYFPLFCNLLYPVTRECA